LSISELALLLLLSTGPTLESFELGMEKEDEFDEEHDDDETEDGLFGDEYRIMTLEKDLLWPHSSSLSLVPSVVLLLTGEAMYLLLLIWLIGFFLQVLNCEFDSSSALGCCLLGSITTRGYALMEVVLRIELTTGIT